VLPRPLEPKQFTSVRFTERLDELGARPSIGTVADSYDNALAETTNGIYKAECVYVPDTNGWDDVEHLELATLGWVHWFNQQRLPGHCGDVPPAEFEAAFYAAQQTDQLRSESNNQSLQQTHGGSPRMSPLSPLWFVGPSQLTPRRAGLVRSRCRKRPIAVLIGTI
jgi:hypothetical protein